MKRFAFILTLCILIGTACHKPNPGDKRADIVTVFGSAGTTDGKFSAPRALEVDSEGNVYIIDKTGRVQVFNRDLSFKYSFVLPDYSKGTPTGFCISPDNQIFIADTHYSRILVYDTNGNLIHSFGQYGDSGGKMIYPTDVAIDKDGNIYVSEYGKNDRIIKFSKDYVFVKEWGGAGTEQGKFQRPMALAIDRRARLLVCDSCNHRVQVFDLDGNFITSFGSVGKAPGELKYPYDISVDAEGNIYVCEYGNCRVQKFSPDGKSLALFGEAGRNPGQLNAPWGVALFGDNRIIVADTGNNRMEIFRLE
ncbi:SMP-30/gluconolactonase/LRE family protein [Candidatus Sumerlaeota bacterium]|nr:SMP-30/gluconolactonase/LRE family protein [Candidatus Sumerlaeota bacterium]